jgi:hypothetical protein
MEKLSEALFAKPLGDLDVGERAEVEHKAGFIRDLPATGATADRALTSWAGSAGSGSTITVNMPPGSDGDDVVGALSRWVQLNGPLPDQLTGVGR